MTGKIIYYICDGCKNTTLNKPDMEISDSGEYTGGDWHICETCADSDWFYCKRCKKAHQFECPIEAAKADAKLAQWEAENAAELAAAKARNDAIPF